MRSRGLGRSGGARDSQLLLGYIVTGMFSKIHLDITTRTTTEEHYIIRIAAGESAEPGLAMIFPGL